GESPLRGRARKKSLCLRRLGGAFLPGTSEQSAYTPIGCLTPTGIVLSLKDVMTSALRRIYCHATTHSPRRAPLPSRACTTRGQDPAHPAGPRRSSSLYGPGSRHPHSRPGGGVRRGGSHGFRSLPVLLDRRAAQRTVDDPPGWLCACRREGRTE